MLTNLILIENKKKSDVIASNAFAMSFECLLLSHRKSVPRRTFEEKTFLIVVYNLKKNIERKKIDND